MPLNVLVVGAGVCGPAFASLLLRSNPTHNITVIERGSELRVAGAQIDVKTQAIPLLKNMGLLDKIKARTVQEDGMEMVDSNDKVLASFGVTAADKRGLTLTSEYEIMRGDLVKILHEDSVEQRARAVKQGVKEGALKYEFGKTVTDLTQTDNGADVTFSDGETKRFDVVIAADGQGSRTRRLAFGTDVSNEAFKSLGIHAAYFSIPRTENEGGTARGYFAQSRFLLTRPSNRPVTGAYLFTTLNQEQLKASYKEPIEKQKDAWAEVLKGAGWQEERLCNGLRACDDFYAHEQGQVKMPNLYKGRVVLLGDAGYCPSPFTGLGTTLSLAGSYVLAGELAKNGNDVSSALQAYEKHMRPMIDECQQIPMGGLGVMFPSSKIGVWVLKTFIWAISTFRIDKLMNGWMADDKTKGGQGWKAPEYPGLNLRV